MFNLANLLQAIDVTHKIPVSIEWCQSKFNKYDTDKSGTLDHDELMELVGQDMYYR